MKTWRVAVHATFMVKAGPYNIYGNMAAARIARDCKLPHGLSWEIYPAVEAETAREARKIGAMLFRLDHPESNEPGDISGIIATLNKPDKEET